jgi:hypothetical protein
MTGIFQFHCNFFFFFFCGAGVWTQGLHLEPLHQPFLWWFFVFFETESQELFAWAGFELWSSWSASWVTRITGVSHRCLASSVIIDGTTVVYCQSLTNLSSCVLRDIVLTAWCSLWSEDLQILCVPPERIHGRTWGCKGSFLKIREEKYKGEHGGAQVKSGGGENVLLLFRCF